MPWIKKNLTLVLGGLVGLILLGGSGFFLFTQASRDGQVTTDLEAKKQEWDQLNALSPFPEEKNIKAVREEAGRVETLASSLKGLIVPVEVPPVTDTFSLKVLIETTISQLSEEAEAAGVNLPDRYAFTFQRLREMPQFDSNGIPKLAEQVGQIAALTRVLFRAKIHSLNTLRRSPVLREEGGSSDYLTKKSVTNNWVVRTPYDLSFTAFSGELAEVLRGLALLPACIAVKTVNVEPTTLPQAGFGPSYLPMPSSMPQPPPGMMPRSEGGGTGIGGMDPALRARYGLGPSAGGGGEGGGLGAAGMDPALRSRYGLGPPGAAGGEAAMRSRYGMGGGGQAVAPPPSLMTPVAPSTPMMMPSAPAGPAVVLDEKPLRVILQLDFIKPRPAAEAGGRRTTRTPAPDAAPDAAPEAAPEAGADAADAPESE